MGVLDKILNELDELYIVKHVTRKHDEARSQYSLKSITVKGDHEFDRLMGEYYNYHFPKCNSPGATFNLAYGTGKAKEIVFGDYRRRGMDKLRAYADGKNGTNGGMREILDIIAEGLKEEAVNLHVRDVFDRYIKPSSFNEQRDIVKELISRINGLPNYIDRSSPERYARDYEDLIKGLAESLKNVFSKLRRI